jgi:hypothetical protein
MGMTIGVMNVTTGANLANVRVPTFLVAGGLDRNSFQSVSEFALTQIPSADKRFLALPLATHRTFDSTYCAQLQSAGARAQGNPRALLDMHTVNLIAAAPPTGISGKAINYCARSFFTTPVDIGPLIASTPNTESALVGGQLEAVPGGTSVCLTTSIPCTGLETEAVEVQMAQLAAEFFGAKLARAASGGVSGTVPATLSLSLGAPASFGAFTPGVARDYSASSAANVVSSAGNAVLSVADPSATATGRLVNGAFSLAQPLQAQASSAGGAGAAFAAVGGSSAPTTLLTYAGPVSNDAVTLAFRQSIAANEALRTGAYAKTLTFTLSTSAP